MEHVCGALQEVQLLIQAEKKKQSKTLNYRFREQMVFIHLFLELLSYTVKIEGNLCLQNLC